MKWATLTCSKCQRVTIRKTGNQKRCPECQDNGKGYRPKDDLASARGLSVSQQARQSIAWPTGGEPDLVTLVRFSLPFSSAFSKNRMFSLTRDKDGIVMRDAARKAKASIAWSTKCAVAKSKFYQGKVWLDIFVQKVAENADAVNVVDLVCDGVKVGLGVDDKWFSIRRLDWEIVKVNPMIFIGIGQEIVEDHFTCRYCGFARPQKHFATRRMCLECKGIGIVDETKEIDETD